MRRGKNWVEVTFLNSSFSYLRGILWVSPINEVWFHLWRSLSHAAYACRQSTLLLDLKKKLSGKRSEPSCFPPIFALFFFLHLLLPSPLHFSKIHINNNSTYTPPILLPSTPLWIYLPHPSTLLLLLSCSSDHPIHPSPWGWESSHWRTIPTHRPLPEDSDRCRSEGVLESALLWIHFLSRHLSRGAAENGNSCG